MTAWNEWPERVLADVAASAPEPPELPRRHRVIGYAVLVRLSTGEGRLSDLLIREHYDEAVREAGRWNRDYRPGTAVVVELREVQC